MCEIVDGVYRSEACADLCRRLAKSAGSSGRVRLATHTRDMTYEEMKQAMPKMGG